MDTMRIPPLEQYPQGRRVGIATVPSNGFYFHPRMGPAAFFSAVVIAVHAASSVRHRPLLPDI